MRRAILLFFAATLAAEEFPIAPYTDPAQLDCPWPQSSHYKQPWRGYLETRSGYDFLQGIGINLHLPDANEELAIKLLAETGFKTARSRSAGVNRTGMKRAEQRAEVSSSTPAPRREWHSANHPAECASRCAVPDEDVQTTAAGGCTERGDEGEDRQLQ
jgi:hypothetical protein